MPNTLLAYASARNQLLTQIISTLKSDDCFIAAWLTGSFGRGEQDELSDLDLTVVVANSHSQDLCARPWQSGARTTGERLALFKQFGDPAIIYEAHDNAPEGGTFTYVAYSESALNVDWILVPQAIAQRDQDTLLLFEKERIPIEAPPVRESLEQRIEEASVQVGYFWLMTPIAIKYMLRNAPIAFQDFLETLHHSVRKVAGLVAGEPVPYHRGAYAKLCVTQEERIAAIRHLCEEMLELMAKVVQLGGYAPACPLSIVDIWLAMADNADLQRKYAADRGALLTRLVSTLQADERFVAAWLAGGYGRHEQDLLSDLDLRIVVSDAYSESLCAVPWESGVPKATPERLAFVRQFGEPCIIWEAKSFVSPPSSFTLTYYAKTGLHVDWVLLPQANARREQKSFVLFDKVGILIEPLPEPESLEQRITLASDRVGFFWMIAVSCIKFLIRGDLAYFHSLLDWLHNSLYEVRRVLAGEPFEYHYERGATILLTCEEQVAAVRDLCNRMLELMPEVVQLGGYVPSSPSGTLWIRCLPLDLCSSA